jgi:hypothetical protein
MSWDMNLDLTDEEKTALIGELDRNIADDRCEAPGGAFAERSASYPLSPRIMTLKAILAKLRPAPASSRAAEGGTSAEPIREPLPETKTL